MPLRDHMKLISVDDHLFENAGVWQTRLPQKHKDLGPRMVDDGEHKVWLYEGTRDKAFKYLSTMAGKSPEEYSPEPVRPEEFRPGCLDSGERVKDMDIDGVQAQLCFPSYPRFSGTRFLYGKDKELALACVQAYNDFVMDEWCAVAPDRYISVIILPLWDVPLAIAETQRMAEGGAKTISFPENTVPLGLPSIHTRHWDPLFSAIGEVGLPLSIHIGTSGNQPQPSPESSDPARMALSSCNTMALIAEWIFSHVFHEFPSLKVALSEGGIGWLPYMREKLDYIWDRQKYWSGINKDVRPSELMDDHIYGCFIDDIAGIRNRDLIGVGNIMWESDYPHADTTWPRSRERLGELLIDTPDKEAHMIAELNARELYNFYDDVQNP